MTRDDLIDHLQCLEEHIAEFGAEMANERAMFGDSGPGTQLRLNEMRQRAAELQGRLNATMPGYKLAFRGTREQWKKAWRDARTIAREGREPRVRRGGHVESLVWHAFNLVYDRPWHSALPHKAIDRLRWKRQDDDWDIPF